MAANAGFNGQCKIGANVIALVKSSTFDLETMMDDISAFKASPTPYKDFFPTQSQATCQLTVEWDLTDTNGQLAMQNAWFASPPTLLSFVLTPNNGTNTYSFSAYIKKLAIKTDVSKVVEWTIDLQPTGTITKV